MARVSARRQRAREGAALEAAIEIIRARLEAGDLDMIGERFQVGPARGVRLVVLDRERNRLVLQWADGRELAAPIVTERAHRRAASHAEAVRRASASAAARKRARHHRQAAHQVG